MSLIKLIAERINVSLDTLVFVDDQVFEREEVAAALPMVRCFDAASAADLVDLLDLRGKPITDESRARRLMYQAKPCAPTRRGRFRRNQSGLS